MYSFSRLSALSLLALNLAAQTNNVAQRLGYPVDAKLLILTPTVLPLRTLSSPLASTPSTLVRSLPPASWFPVRS
jgi:hypothetical protein